ncbi:MAG TPA: helix-turn-helix domain-containing protein [Vicinamibacterales bacterium]|nr:helix-turn-helix domain-containing protein [Vicinamibacterales bacterium]
MSDFGGKLRQARERRGLSLRQIAASTKISVTSLEALERNETTRLPGGLFSRAFVRAYAIEVGLDPDETIREFVEETGCEPVPAPMVAVATREMPFEPPLHAGVLLKLGVAALGLLLLVAAAWAGVAAWRGHERARVTAAVIAPAPAPAARPVAEGTKPAPTPPAGQTITLDLHPTAACWVSLTVDGRRIVSRIMQPGEHETHVVRQDAVIEIGNAGAFAFSIDGRPGRALGGSGQVRSARITPATAASFLK